jgi:hypothetical protein
LRIQMVQSKRLEKPGGGAQEFLMGRYYLVPNKQAREWIAEGAAVDPEAPPVETAPTEPAPETEKEGGR